MSKTKVERLAEMIASLKKKELRELVGKLALDYSICTEFTIPMSKVAEPIGDGYLLKTEAEKHKAP